MYTYNTGRILARPEKEHRQYLAILEQIPLAMKRVLLYGQKKAFLREQSGQSLECMGS